MGFAADLGALRTSPVDEKTLQAIQALIDEEKLTPEIRAEAYVALGRAHQEAGDHRRALLSFLRVCFDPPLMPFPGPRADALHLAAEAFGQVKSADWRERSAALRGELQSKYPNSRWVQ